MNKITTELEKVIGDALAPGRVYADADFAAVGLNVIERAKRASVKAVLNKRGFGGFQIHFSFKDHTALALNF